MIRITVDTTQWVDRYRRFISGIAQYKLLVLHESGEVLKEFAESITPEKTGEMKASWDYEMDEKYATVMIFNTSPVIRFLNVGTDPHFIQPKVSRYLKFVSGDAVFFRRSVYHPGIVAIRFDDQIREYANAKVPEIAIKLF